MAQEAGMDPTGRRRRLRAVTCGVILVPVLASCGGGGQSGRHHPAAPASTCQAAAQRARVTSVVPDAQWDSVWASYVATNTGWTDGDSVYAYSVPQVGRLWTFADSYIGGLNPDGSRKPGIWHNLFVTQGAHGFRVITGPDNMPLVGPRSGKLFYLSSGGADEGATFQEFLVEWRRVGQPSLAITPIRTVVATFAVPSFHLLKVETLSGRNAGIYWGAFVTKAGGFTYIYGSSTTRMHKHAYVARTSGDDLAGIWSYWDGQGWSTDPSAVAPILANVGQQFSVTPFDRMYLFMTDDGSRNFSPYAIAWFGCSPTGPFVNPNRFLVSPLTMAAGAGHWGDAEVYVYDEIVQPALSGGGRVVMSYDQNTLNVKAVLAHADIYRPSYLDVHITVPPSGQT